MAYVLGVEKDDGLEAVVAASLKFKNAFLMDEHCSCIVQEKFIPSGYQNFEDMLLNVFVHLLLYLILSLLIFYNILYLLL